MALQRNFFPHRAVGNRGQVGIDGQFDIKRRLVPGMIETGERPTGITFLELRHGHEVVLVVPPVAAAVKPGHAVVDQAVEIEFEGKGPRDQRCQPDFQRLLLRIERKFGWDRHITLHRRAALDLEFDGVQVQHRQWHGGRHRQPKPAVKGKLFQMRFDLQRIVNIG
jgi:hypothetical protein